MANLEKVIAKGPSFGRGLVPRSRTDKPIYVGLDVHKRAWVVTVLCQGVDPDRTAGWCCACEQQQTTNRSLVAKVQQSRREKENRTT